MSGTAVEAANGRLERELAYYRREVNDLGAKLIRSQEEQQRAFFEAQRSRLVVKMVRELYRVGDLSAAGASLSDLVLGVVVENAMCSCGALFHENPVGSGSFNVVSAVGLPAAERPPLLRLRHTPPFVITTATAKAESPASDIVAVMGKPYILWTYDTGSGYALALGNQREDNVSRPFELADQELIETALTVFLDAQSRAPRVPFSTAENEAEQTGEQHGLDIAILKRQLSRGGRVAGVVVVERPGSSGREYVPYFNVTWQRGWHVLRGWKETGDRRYRRFDSLLEMVRSDLKFTGLISTYSLDSSEMEYLPSIAEYERQQRAKTEPLLVVDPPRPGKKPSRLSKVRAEAGV